jgi:hypothetical protein
MKFDSLSEDIFKLAASLLARYSYCAPRICRSRGPVSQEHRTDAIGNRQYTMRVCSGESNRKGYRPCGTCVRHFSTLNLEAFVVAREDAGVGLTTNPCWDLYSFLEMSSIKPLQQ